MEYSLKKTLPFATDNDVRITGVVTFSFVASRVDPIAAVRSVQFR